jgi:hypothetical protein
MAHVPTTAIDGVAGTERSIVAPDWNHVEVGSAGTTARVEQTNRSTRKALDAHRKMPRWHERLLADRYRPSALRWGVV